MIYYYERFINHLKAGGCRAGKWAQDMASYVKGKGLALKKLFFSCTTCPACAKAYGKNHVVLFAQV